MELRLGVSTLPLKMKKNFIYYLQLIWFISFLLIFTPGEIQLPLIVFLFIFLYQFIYDIVTLPHSHEIFWEGLLTLFIISTLVAGVKAKLYKERYFFIFCVIALLSVVGLFYYIELPIIRKGTDIFNFVPLLILFTTSLLLILKHFRLLKEK